MLETNQINPQNAFEDIECYKMVYRKDETSCISYVVGYEYTIGQDAPEVQLNRSEDAFTDVDGSKFFIVSNGYHSYRKKEDIQLCDKTVIARCIIPAGSQFFMDPYSKCYASTSIRIVEIIS